MLRRPCAPLPLERTGPQFCEPEDRTWTSSRTCWPASGSVTVAWNWIWELVHPPWSEVGGRAEIGRDEPLPLVPVAVRLAAVHVPVAVDHSVREAVPARVHVRPLDPGVGGGRVLEG